jgi:uncharacterized protein (TIGR04222 family)
MQLFSSWTGSDFLLFYIMLLALSAFAAWWIPANLRDSGRTSESPDAEDVAMLAGGRVSHTDSVIADLFARGGLKDDGKNKLRVAEHGLLASPAGRALLAARQPFSRSEADSMVAIHASRITARLRREGLLLRPDALTRLRWLSIVPFVSLFVIGLYRQRAGAALGEPTGFLMILMGLTAALVVFRFAKFDKRTIAGIAAVTQLREKSSRLRRAPQASESAMAVALFGTGVLVGTPWEPVHAMRQQGSGDGGGSSDSSGDGGSDGGGDGGGGCGGCGG